MFFTGNGRIEGFKNTVTDPERHRTALEIVNGIAFEMTYHFSFQESLYDVEIYGLPHFYFVAEVRIYAVPDLFTFKCQLVVRKILEY